MAVQKSRKSRSKRGMRRSHDSITSLQVSIDTSTLETHVRHYVTKTGFYRGKSILVSKDKQNQNKA